MVSMIQERVDFRSHHMTVILSYPEKGSICFGATLFPPHPDLGGSRDHPLLMAVAETVVKAGGIALRYEYPNRSIQETKRNGPVIPDDEFPNLLAPTFSTLALMRKTIPQGKPHFAFGYSLGACVMAQFPEVLPWQRPVFVAPPLAKQKLRPLTKKGEDALVILGDCDFSCQEADAREWLWNSTPTHKDKRTLHMLPGTDHFLRGEENFIAELTLAHWRIENDPILPQQ